MHSIGPKASLFHGPDIARLEGIRMFGTCSAERLELVRSLGADAAGKLTPVIDSVIPLARAAEAHERMKSCAVKGKIVLDCS